MGERLVEGLGFAPVERGVPPQDLERRVAHPLDSARRLPTTAVDRPQGFDQRPRRRLAPATQLDGQNPRHDARRLRHRGGGVEREDERSHPQPQHAVQLEAGKLAEVGVDALARRLGRQVTVRQALNHQHPRGGVSPGKDNVPRDGLQRQQERKGEVASRVPKGREIARGDVGQLRRARLARHLLHHEEPGGQATGRAGRTVAVVANQRGDARRLHGRRPAGPPHRPSRLAQDLGDKVDVAAVPGQHPVELPRVVVDRAVPRGCARGRAPHRHRPARPVGTAVEDGVGDEGPVGTAVPGD